MKAQKAHFVTPALRASCALWLALSIAGCPDNAGVEDDFCSGASDGTRCDDKNECTVDDRCGQGVCEGHAVADGGDCDDGDGCTVDDECRAGVCVGLDLCVAPDGPDGSGTTPDPECQGRISGDLCDDGDLCTTDDRCDDQLQCAGAPVECPDDPTACTLGSCDPATGACLADTAPDGSGCDDLDPCKLGETCTGGLCGGGTTAAEGTPCNDNDEQTLNDRCAAGVCSGTPRPCEEGCCGAEDGKSCDDGDLCTESDHCESERCVGDAKEIDCSDLDDTCRVGACDPRTGACTQVAVIDGNPCDDGDPCTPQSACQQGSCQGAPLDCSHLNGPCVVGVCDGGTCEEVPRAENWRCNDGDPCTGHDVCDGNKICAGSIDLCAACEDLKAGAPCDDGDPCTRETGVCVQVAGGLRCDSPIDLCATSSGPCAQGACVVVQEGEESQKVAQCVAVPKHAGAGCDDGDPCTLQDACTDGVCVGSQDGRWCEDAPPDYCEPGATNDTLATAIPLASPEGDYSLYGTLPTAGDTDWYALTVRAGQLLDATTRGHCGSAVATVLTTVRPNGETTVTTGLNGGFAALIGDRTGGEGTYYVGVARLDSGSSSSAGYFLDLKLADAPPCNPAAGCGCANLKCVTGGAGAGLCLPGITVELESNDGTDRATELATGASALGRLGSASDEDWYRLELDEGVPLTLTTTPTCDEAAVGEDVLTADDIDTRIRLYAADGITELAAADNGPMGARAAQLRDYVVPTSGTYYVRVTGTAGALGPYLLEAMPTPCNAGGCSCPDQVCSAETGGVCIPLLSAPEPSSGQPAEVPLQLGERVHAEIDVPYDKDTYTITLGEGSYDVVTTDYCGATLDTALTVSDGDATAQPIRNDDGGEGLFAAVMAFEVEPENTKTLHITVEAGGGAVGPYVIVVRAATEAP